jgi:hypothetical protein
VTQAASQNLSGEWKLNFAKSNYGKFPAPSSMTRKIAHNDPKLLLSTTQKGAQGEVTSKLVYTTDGKESINQVAGGEAKGIAQWIGDKLMIESSREFQGATLKQKDIWTLSDDGIRKAIAAGYFSRSTMRRTRSISLVSLRSRSARDTT